MPNTMSFLLYGVDVEFLVYSLGAYYFFPDGYADRVKENLFKGCVFLVKKSLRYFYIGRLKDIALFYQRIHLSHEYARFRSSFLVSLESDLVAPGVDAYCRIRFLFP